MEKKARVKRLNHQDDVKRSWAAVYPLTESFEDILSEDWERAEAELDFTEDGSLPISPSIEQYDEDRAGKKN